MKLKFPYEHFYESKAVVGLPGRTFSIPLNIIDNICA